jgi:hypothetical protein
MPGSRLDLDQFTHNWFAMERRLGLFADRVAGIPWWDVVRYRFNEFVSGGLANVEPLPEVRRALPLRALGLAKRLALRTLLAARARSRHHDVLVLRAPRQFLNGAPLDPAIDQLRELCPGRQLIINTYPSYYHLPRPGAAHRQVDVGPVLDSVLAALRTEFGLHWDEMELRRLVARLLADFLTDKAAYRTLIARVKPKFILITQNGIEKALFAAAHEEGVPVVEAQHGLIGYSHPAYSYPRDAEYGDRSTFPTIFTTFSDYWLRNCYYPAGRCVPLGNDHFVLTAPPVRDLGEVMFISGALYHAVLVEWVRELARGAPERRLIYKLHPNQQATAAEITQELADLANVEVIDGSISARTLMHRVSHVVLIQSTVALEALQMGRRLCILPFLHYRVHEDLFGLAAVTVAGDIDSLLRAIRKPPEPGLPPVFFERLDVRAARLLMNEFN